MHASLLEDVNVVQYLTIQHWHDEWGPSIIEYSSPTSEHCKNTPFNDAAAKTAPPQSCKAATPKL